MGGRGEERGWGMVEEGLEREERSPEVEGDMI
jgi:hypothetical protein